MKTKIEINNGHAKIVLTTENEFERTLIDNVIEDDYKKTVKVNRDYSSFGSYKNRQIIIELDEKKEDTQSIVVSLD